MNLIDKDGYRDGNHRFRRGRLVDSARMDMGTYKAMDVPEPTKLGATAAGSIKGQPPHRCKEALGRVGFGLFAAGLGGKDAKAFGFVGVSLGGVDPAGRAMGTGMILCVSIGRT